MIRKLGLFVAALVIACLAAGCGSTTAPAGNGVNLGDLAGWFGTYARVDTSTNCQTQVVTAESGTLTLCSKSALLSPTSFGLHCTTQSVSATHVNYSCSGKVFYAGDSIPVVIIAAADKSGEKIYATARITASTILGTVCNDFRYTLTRTSTDTSNCDVTPFSARWISAALRNQGR
jgi:hypothetical protein